MTVDSCDFDYYIKYTKIAAFPGHGSQEGHGGGVGQEGHVGVKPKVLVYILKHNDRTQE